MKLKIVIPICISFLLWNRATAQQDSVKRNEVSIYLGYDAPTGNYGFEYSIPMIKNSKSLSANFGIGFFNRFHGVIFSIGTSYFFLPKRTLVPFIDLHLSLGTQGYFSWGSEPNTQYYFIEEQFYFKPCIGLKVYSKKRVLSFKMRVGYSILLNDYKVKPDNNSTDIYLNEIYDDLKGGPIVALGVGFNFAGKRIKRHHNKK